MSERMLNLKQAAEHVHMDVNELRHFAQRGEVEALERGSDWLFDHRALDEWAQRNLLLAGKRELKRQHSLIMDECRRASRAGSEGQGRDSARHDRPCRPHRRRL